MRVLHRLEGGEGRQEEEFMWRGKERKMRETGIDGKQISRKYRGRVPEVVQADNAMDGKCVAFSGSLFGGPICITDGMGGKFIDDDGFEVLVVR